MFGPGEITGADIGIDAQPNSEVGSLVVRDVSIHGNLRIGARASKHLTATNVSADDNDIGLIANFLVATEVTASGNSRKAFEQVGAGNSV